MAGNDLALIKSQEAAEDDVVRSIEDLKRKSEGYERVVFIGITCGLSAPYVGSQIEYILNTPAEVRSFVRFLLDLNRQIHNLSSGGRLRTHSIMTKIFCL